MARTLNGTTDRLKCSIGGLSGFNYGTAASIFRFVTGTDSTQAIADINNSSGNSFLVAIQMISDTNQLAWYTSSASKATTTLTSGNWYCAVTRKATGTATPRHSWYSYSSGTWTHENGSGTQADVASPTSTPLLCLDVENSFDRFAGDIAVRAVWSNSLPWTADSTGDALIAASGLPFNLMSWLAAAPSVLHVFDQSATSQNVYDWTGGGANQSSLTGTSVASASVPDFSYGARTFASSPSASVANPNAEAATATGQAFDASIPGPPVMLRGSPVRSALRLN